ncbi:PUA domain-containing protein, partial [Symbiobacterium thermophilum]|uniref:PUA domain-containing protein n=1 Tax=Symbiobacterium thermophilum TaxID=2734 RepID=UPI00308112B5
ANGTIVLNLNTEGEKAMAVVQLARGRHRRVQAGHPWVFQGDVEEVRGEFAPGDVVTVVDFRGRLLGKGYINPAS